MSDSFDGLEIRLLGQFQVRLADQSLVDPDAWTTGKTADLLRILAMSADRPVREYGLLEKLWPDIDEVKAKASLRTALSQLRRVVGSQHVARNLNGIMLVDSWVDVTAFSILSAHSKASFEARNYSEVVAAAREAEGLHVGEFTAHDERGPWATETRELLKVARLTMLANAAESAFQLGWMRDTIVYATTAVGTEPCFERAYRSLMFAHTSLGETELALRAYEHCKSMLAQELGADPSAQTQAALIQVLSGEVTLKPIPQLAGREDEVAELCRVIKDTESTEGPHVLCLMGVDGCGRESLLQQAVDQLPHRSLNRILTDEHGIGLEDQLAGVLSDREGEIAFLRPESGTAIMKIAQLATVISDLHTKPDKIIAIPTSVDSGRQLVEALAGSSLRVHMIEVGPVSDDDLQQIADIILAGAVSDRLLTTLKARSANIAGRAVDVLRQWSLTGRIISTSKGLEVIADNMHPGGPQFDQLHRVLLSTLSVRQFHICQMLALLDRPLGADCLLTVLEADQPGGHDRDEVQALFNRLHDLHVLKYGLDGYEFRHFAIREAIVAWMRPSARRAMLERVTSVAG